MRIMNGRLILSVFLCALAMTFVLGCGGVKKPDGFPKLIKNSDFTLTQDGKPLEGAEVHFFKADEGGNDDSRWGVFGTSDETGLVKLMTHKDAFKGAPAGKYKVTVVKDEITPSQYGTTPPEKGSEIVEWQKKRMEEYRPCYHLVDPNHMAPETSELFIEITADGASPNTLELGPAVREEYIPQGTSPNPGMSAEEVQAAESEAVAE